MLAIGLSNETYRYFMRPSPLLNTYSFSVFCPPYYLKPASDIPYSRRISKQDDDDGEDLEGEPEGNISESDPEIYLDLDLGLELNPYYNSYSVPPSSSFYCSSN